MLCHAMVCHAMVCHAMPLTTHAIDMQPVHPFHAAPPEQQQ